MTRLLAVIGGTVASFAAIAGARQVDVPLRFDHEFIRQALVAQVYTEDGGKAVLWDDGTGCGYLKLRDPSVDAAGKRVRIVTRGEARVGTSLGDQCLTAVQWDGYVEVVQEPEVSPDRHTLQFRVVESNIYDSDWKKGVVTGNLWDLVKRYAHPRFDAVRIDLHPGLRDLRDVLPLVIARDDAARVAQILDSLRLSAATADATGVAVTLSFDVSPVTPTAAPTPEPTLTADELHNWEAAWQRWDAFVTFVVKQMGHDTSAKDARLALTDVLTQARFDILEALAPSAPGAADPTRALFLKTWERLSPLARRMASSVPGGRGLQLLSFVQAGDALAALDALGADVGLDISADGLRRLARIVAPATADDPLVYTTTVDPELRQLFGFGAPLPAPEIPADAQDEAWWHMLLPASAFAVGEDASAKTLQQWIAERDVIETYLQAVRDVLRGATKTVLGNADLETGYRELYRRLVLATAWQESCWRQFIRTNGKVMYMRSPVGSTGMMQVNEHVWRGLYELRGLRWDIRYNGRAGAEILMHYLQDYAVAHHEDVQPGGIDNLARATYAVYNGGPGQLARYRKKTTRKSLRRIDALFWQKYLAVSAGKEMDVTKCLVGE